MEFCKLLTRKLNIQIEERLIRSTGKTRFDGSTKLKNVLAFYDFPYIYMYAFSRFKFELHRGTLERRPLVRRRSGDKGRGRREVQESIVREVHNTH